MPPGSKKRKALKKKKELEALGATTTNNIVFNTHGNDEYGSQEETESDGSLSSPCSQGNVEVWKRESSPSPLSGAGKVMVKENTEDGDASVGQGAGRSKVDEGNGVDKPSSVVEIAPDVDSSVSTVVISDKNEQVERSVDSDSLKQETNGNGEKVRVEEEAKHGNGSGSQVQSVLPSGALPVVRTSWLSCCGLFDMMGGSER